MTRPRIMAMVVVLPAPLPPSSPVIEPGAQRKRNAVDRAGGLVDLDQLVDGDGGLGGMWTCRYTVCADRTCGASGSARQGRNGIAVRPSAAARDHGRGIRPRLRRRREGLHCRHDRATRRGGPPHRAQRAPRHAGAAALARGDRPDHRGAGGLFRARLRAADLGLPRGDRARRPGSMSRCACAFR